MYDQRRARAALLIFLVLSWGATSLLRPETPRLGWRVSLEVAQLRVSVEISDQSVRQRTALFDIGQSASGRFQ